jgi:hypothetical protein
MDPDVSGQVRGFLEAHGTQVALVRKFMLQPGVNVVKYFFPSATDSLGPMLQENLRTKHANVCS